MLDRLRFLLEQIAKAFARLFAPLFPPRSEASPMADHLGQVPANHITLRSVHLVDSQTQMLTEEWWRVKPDGSDDQNDYVVPTGKVLVVTDVGWSYSVFNLLQSGATALPFIA